MTTEPLSPAVIHISARAIEWLEKATSFYGYRKYAAPHATRVCDGQPMLCAPNGRCAEVHCAVEDVRALYLQMKYKVIVRACGRGMYIEGNYTQNARREPLVLTNCFDCRVAFDRACERSAKKTGKWLVETRAGTGQRHMVWTNGEKPKVSTEAQKLLRCARKFVPYTDTDARLRTLADRFRTIPDLY